MEVDSAIVVGSVAEEVGSASGVAVDSAIVVDNVAEEAGSETSMEVAVEALTPVSLPSAVVVVDSATAVVIGAEAGGLEEVMAIPDTLSTVFLTVVGM
ncbi:hypothetical protein, partial [Endozoicomonas acroporae]|uniref:hypothetical protein n=1 Tax=Endozoicomonas acroporae TaxID=1701104 RepID=UPI003D7C0316